MTYIFIISTAKKFSECIFQSVKDSTFLTRESKKVEIFGLFLFSFLKNHYLSKTVFCLSDLIARVCTGILQYLKWQLMMLYSKLCDQIRVSTLYLKQFCIAFCDNKMEKSIYIKEYCIKKNFVYSVRNTVIECNCEILYSS